MDNDHKPLDVNISHEDLRILHRKGLIGTEQYNEALSFSGILPDKIRWQGFLQILLSSLGTLFLLTGIMFFFAYNWADMSKWQKFVGIEALIITALIFGWYKGSDRLPGKLAILAVGTLIGILMAVYGQIYQTGADPYELFMYWAAILLPLVIAVRFPAFWLMWLVIVNIAITLYIEQALGGREYTKYIPHISIGINLIFLAAWNFCQQREIAWMQEPWVNWIVAIACLVPATFLGIIAIDSLPRQWNSSYTDNTLNTILYIFTAGGFFAFYRYFKRDLFILTLVIISLGILSLVLYFQFRWHHNTFKSEALVVATLILVEAILAAHWLRKIHLKWSVQS